MLKQKTQSRSTRQRKAVYEAVVSLHDHPTADRIFFEVRKRLPSVSLGTVYRNLNVLVQQGLVAEFSTPDNVRRYDGNTNRHGHIICTECGRISDVIPPSAAIEEIMRQSEKTAGYRTAWCRVEVYGVCPTCLAGQSLHASERHVGLRGNDDVFHRPIT